VKNDKVSVSKLRTVCW